jgi:hypothetical protein
VDLTQLDSADQIMDSALAADRRVLVDLPAQSHRFLRRWVETADVLGYAKEMGVRLVFWHVTDGGFDSVSHLEQLLSLLGNGVQCVVVKNQGRSDDFAQFDASPGQQRLLELGGQVTTLPELDAAAMYKIDRFGSSFWAAINTSEGPRALTRLERRRAKVWLDRAHTALAISTGEASVTANERISKDAAPGNGPSSNGPSNNGTSSNGSSDYAAAPGDVAPERAEFTSFN